MSYIGNVPTTATFPFDQFSGNGSTTAFTLTYAPAGSTSIIVSISGVVQNPNTYSVSGTTITFSPAPPSGTNNIAVLYLGLPVVASMTGTMGFIAGSANNPPIFPTGDTNTGIYFPAADTIAFAEGGTEAMRIDSSSNVVIGTTNTLGNSLLSVAQGVAARNSGATLPYFQTYNSNAGTDLKTWRFGGNNSGALAFETVNDAYSSATSQAAITSAGLFQFNSGYGSVATAYGCRAWVNFNGTGTVAIRASGNVSSITDNGTGDYTVNFTTAMPDANYACAVTNNRLAGTTNAGSGTRDGGLTTGGARVVVNNWASPFSAQDVAEVFVAIFR